MFQSAFGDFRRVVRVNQVNSFCELSFWPGVRSVAFNFSLRAI